SNPLNIARPEFSGMSLLATSTLTTQSDVMAFRQSGLPINSEHLKMRPHFLFQMFSFRTAALTGALTKVQHASPVDLLKTRDHTA
ncbi:hypothetical protein, partial [Nitrospira sp. BLG_2]|uniref:hypothetical protein n=1 Tax=Nitrospira sp. BLG_2 TaxID=3397507 RepID=UPI003B9A0B01